MRDFKQLIQNTKRITLSEMTKRNVFSFKKEKWLETPGKKHHTLFKDEAIYSGV